MLACGSAFCVVLVRGLRMEVWGVGRVDNVGEDGCESLEKGVEGVVGLVVVMEELDKGLVDGDVDVDVVDVVVVVAAAAAAAGPLLGKHSPQYSRQPENTPHPHEPCATSSLSPTSI